MLKKLLKLSLSALLVSTSANLYADDARVTANGIPVISDLDVKINGYAHFQSAFRNQSELKNTDSNKEKNLSKNRESFAFFNEAAFMADVSNNFNDVKYGAKIVLVPTARRKGGEFNGSHIYLESDYGRMEFGSPFTASGNMFVDGSKNAAGTFDDWSRYAEFSCDYMKNGTKIDPSFSTFAEFFLDSKLVTKLEKRSYSSEPARSISYYTPKFELGRSTKVQLGLSYTPDSSNTGADDPNSNSSGAHTVKLEELNAYKFEFNKSVKDAFTGGVTLEQNFGDGVDLLIALTGEYGKAAGKAKKYATENDDKPIEYKLADLKTYNIGAVFNLGNFSIAGSYGSLGDSLTTPEYHKTGRKTDYYTGTLGYKEGPFAASISYFKSYQFKNTVNAVTLGTHYKLAPGFKPYAEISTFELNGKPEFYPDLKKRKTRGTIALIGAKLSL